MKMTMKKIIIVTLVAVILAALFVAVIHFGKEPSDEDNMSINDSSLDLSSYKVGDLIEFGSYPQNKVTDSDLIAAIETAGESISWVDYNYYAGTGSWDVYDMKPVENMMLYKDISYNGSKYRAVKINQYRPFYTNDLPDDNLSQKYHGYYTGNVYYFKFEHLTWRILDPNKGFVMCNSIIDSQAYQNCIYYDGRNWYNSKDYSNYVSDWATSSLRQWLNDDFYNTAFSVEEKAQICTSHLENKSSDSSIYDGTDTYDRIFPISFYDAINSAYGFNSFESAYDTARQLKGTDYAKCQGLGGWWRLRSPNTTYYTAEMSDEGFVTNGRDGSSATSLGIVPAFNFKV